VRLGADGGRAGTAKEKKLTAGSVFLVSRFELKQNQRNLHQVSLLLRIFRSCDLEFMISVAYVPQ